MLLHYIDVGHDRPMLVRHDLPDLSALAPVTTLHDLDRIVASNLEHGLDHLWREGDDLQIVLLSQLTGHWPENSGALRIELVRKDHHRVLVELDRRSIGSTVLFRGAHDYGLHHVTLLDRAVRYCLFHRAHHDITDPGVLLVSLQ